MSWFANFFYKAPPPLEEEFLDDPVFSRVLENAGLSLDEYQAMQPVKMRRAADRSRLTPAQ